MGRGGKTGQGEEKSRLDAADLGRMCDWSCHLPTALSRHCIK